MSVKFFSVVPEDTEYYIQETGRAGREGRPSLAVLVPTCSAIRKADMTIRTYQSNQECRRYNLFSDHGKILT